MFSSPGIRRLAALCLICSSANAEVVFETGETLTGDMQILAEDGTLSGPNLLHRFSIFNINNGEAATFRGPPDVRNIIAAVTGPETSLIDGLLSSDIPDADLFLLNPNGVIFGSGASLDISGGLYVSTADRLIFDDGSALLVSSTGKTALTMAPPSAFGFDGVPAGITFNGTEIGSEAGALPEKLTVISGDIILDDSNLSLSGATIDLLALAGSTTVSIDVQPPDSSVPQGDIRMTGGRLETSGDPAGNIFINAENVSLSDNAFIFSDTEGSNKGATINVVANNRLDLSGGSRITTDVIGSGQGGDIQIQADAITLSDLNTNIASDTQPGAGDSGNIILKAESLLIENSAQISSRSASESDAGNISVRVADLQILNGGLISGQAVRHGRGADVEINASNQVSISGLNEISHLASGISVSSLNLNFFSPLPGGDAGDIIINTPLLRIDNQGKISAESLTPNSGAPGAIILNTENLELSAGATVSTKTASAKDAGSIEINADIFMISGNSTNISSSTVRQAAGGDIVLNTGIASVNDNAQLTVSTDLSGDAGSILITTDHLSVDGGVINAETRIEGKGGSINLDADSLSIQNKGRIDASTNGSGDAGAIHSHIQNELTILGEDSGISSRSSGSGQGGDINIIAESILIQESGAVEANADGDGFAGDIHLTALTDLRLSEGYIRTNSVLSGGGSISINVENLIYLLDSELTASAQGTANTDNGGNITIDPIFLVLSGSKIVAQAFAGNGGIIELEADNYISGINSLIDASSELGNDGEVRITSPDNSITGVLGILNAEFDNRQNLLRDSCASRLFRNRSSLVVLGKERDLFIPGDLITANQSGYEGAEICMAMEMR